MKEASERRDAIVKILQVRKHETIGNLASEFGVSLKTIQRDLDFLSLTIPIEIKTGRTYGGVYIDKDYKVNRSYMTKDQLAVLKKLYAFVSKSAESPLSENEKITFKTIITQYTNILT